MPEFQGLWYITMAKNNGYRPSTGKITLQELAEHVRLTKGTVSAILNDSSVARTIPQRTKDRVFAAARDLNYRPNFFARNLRAKRTFAIGVITEEIGDAYGGMVISGIEAVLSREKYFFITAAHRHNLHNLEEYVTFLLARGVEGIITIDTILKHPLAVPTVAVAGHRPLKGVTNITLDHAQAAHLALSHLYDSGHRQIAILRGQSFSSDADDRWHSICDAAAGLGIHIPAELAVELDTDDPSPEMGYRLTKQLLSRGHFTALFAYNDISAIGAIRAVREAGLRVPEDISVVGFDDIREAAYHLPSLTTVRQPLRKMGEIAAQTLVDRIGGRNDYPSQILIDPELMVRESTGKAAVRVRGAERGGNLVSGIVRL
jgi:DNA-binding LacI/PurR family transcriptional regulator